MATELTLDDARELPCGRCGHIAVLHVYNGENAAATIHSHDSVFEVVEKMRDVMCATQGCMCRNDVLGAVFSRIVFERQEKEVPF